MEDGLNQADGHAADNVARHVQDGTEEIVESSSPTKEDESSDPQAGADSFQASHFAKRETLSWYFPQILDDEHNSWRIWRSKRSRAILIQITVIVIILITNLALSSFAVSHYGSEAGVGLIYYGECGTVSSLDRWLHLLINLLSTGMLSASNYCMQLQAAPTRKMVDEAHAKGNSLDIGVLSLRNLWRIGRWRKASWLLLAFSSVPIHLIYNSAVFQSLSSSDYTIAVVKDSFLDQKVSWSTFTAEKIRAGDPGWEDTGDSPKVNPRYINGGPANYTDVISQMQVDAITMPYQKLNMSACFGLYEDYWAPQGNALVFVSNQSVQEPRDDSLLMYVSITPRADDWPKNMWALDNKYGNFNAIQPPQPVTNWLLGPPQYRVSYCLVQPLPPDAASRRCRFEYSPQIMFAVCFLNFLKAVVMVRIWLLRRRQDPGDPDAEILYTLGDAISSFMRKPDENTRDMGLANKQDFEREWDVQFKLSKYWLPHVKVARKAKVPKRSTSPRPFRRRRYRWWQAASPNRWFCMLFTGFLVLATATSLLVASVVGLKIRLLPHDIPDFWHMGFGDLTPYTYIVTKLPHSNFSGLISNVVLANMPQLLLSLLYIIFSAMLATFLVQREFDQMNKRRKPLRVSEPIGIQRSSYFISMPLRYGIPLYAMSGILHWLVSQSMFLARIRAVFPDQSTDAHNSFSACAYSPIAIFIAILVAFVAMLGLVAVGFRRYDGTMAMVATNSRAISAACHVLEEDRADSYLLPVIWAVVSMHDDVGKVTFTTAPKHELKDSVKDPVEGKSYI